MPDYLTLYNGNSRLCNTHLDNLSFVTNIASTATSINNLNKSLFFRSHSFWNSLPLEIRNSISLFLFKNKLCKHLWNIELTYIEQYRGGGGGGGGGIRYQVPDFTLVGGSFFLPKTQLVHGTNWWVYCPFSRKKVSTWY